MAFSRTLFTTQVDAARMPSFLADFSAYRFDEALGPWRPYDEVIKVALRRCCQRWGLPAHDAAAQ